MADKEALISGCGISILSRISISRINDASYLCCRSAGLKMERDSSEVRNKQRP